MDVPAPEPIALEDSEALMADLCALTLYLPCGPVALHVHLAARRALARTLSDAACCT